MSECPFSVATHLPVATSHTLSFLSPDADTTRRPSGNIATLVTYDEDTSSQKYSGRRATHEFRVPFQRRQAFAGLDVPDLERLVVRPRHEVLARREDGHAVELRETTPKTNKEDAANRTFSECPSYVLTHFPVATSHSLSVPSYDAETT